MTVATPHTTAQGGGVTIVIPSPQMIARGCVTISTAPDECTGGRVDNCHLPKGLQGMGVAIAIPPKRVQRGGGVTIATRQRIARAGGMTIATPQMSAYGGEG